MLKWETPLSIGELLWRLWFPLMILIDENGRTGRLLPCWIIQTNCDLGYIQTRPNVAMVYYFCIGMWFGRACVLLLEWGFNYDDFCRKGKGNKGWRTFSLKELHAATNNFNYDNKLGEGGFGSVYWGQLWDGSQVWSFFYFSFYFILFLCWDDLLPSFIAFLEFHNAKI